MIRELLLMKSKVLILFKVRLVGPPSSEDFIFQAKNIFWPLLQRDVKCKAQSGWLQVLKCLVQSPRLNSKIRFSFSLSLSSSDVSDESM